MSPIPTAASSATAATTTTTTTAAAAAGAMREDRVSQENRDQKAKQRKEGALHNLLGTRWSVEIFIIEIPEGSHLRAKATLEFCPGNACKGIRSRAGQRQGP
jgi:hypothetical protein